MHGHHRSACSRVGLLKPRGTPAEVCEVIANGLPFWGGNQITIDTTVVSALIGGGEAWGRQEGQAIRLTPTLANPILANPFLAIRVWPANFGQSIFGKIGGKG